MKKGLRIAKYYLLGIFTSVLLVVFIHLYSYLVEPYFSYAQWDNILLTTLISGIPFGIAIWAFSEFVKKYNSQNSNS
jgi:hypothetical protein